MPQLQAHGLAVTPPRGWEGRIFRRPQAGEVSDAAAGAPGAPAPAGEQTYPVVHIATIPLPANVADYASDAVSQLGTDDALVVLKEFGPPELGTAAFAAQGLPHPLNPDDFSPTTLQRTLVGQAGLQRFFTQANRPFCLYVVLGAYANRQAVVPGVNSVLATVQIDPVATPRP